MNPSHPDNSQKLLTLKEAAQKLGVTAEKMLEWNEHNILKPTMTPDGQIGYTEEQVNRLAQINGGNEAGNLERENKTKTDRKSFSLYEALIRWLGNGFYHD